jgi:SWI/SNF-related matrix-associated actin-dependent regulator of chromatin subfamily A-like protein 1
MTSAVDFRPELVQPFPFQIDDAKWLASKKSCLLANEMRVGKTPAVIRAIDLLGLKNILIIVPASVRVHWARELQRFSPLDRPTQVVMPGDKPRTSDVVIISYDMAVTHKDTLKSVAWDVLVGDEIHLTKERTSQRSRMFYGHGKRSPGIISSAARCWRLSGSPCPNNSSELWVHLHSAGLADEDFWSFTFKFCIGFQSDYGFSITGSKNIDELKTRLSGFMRRRTLAEVMPDLPPVTFEAVTVPRSEACLSPEFLPLVPQLAQTDKELQKALGDLAPDGQASMIERAASSMTTLRRFTLMLKLPAIGEQIESELESGGIDKIVIFCVFKVGVEWMAERLRKFGVVTLYGETPAKRRQENIDEFRKGKARVFIGNFIAAGVGIDLTPCTECALLECSFVPGDNNQAVKRLQGVNQKFPVRVRVFSLFGSVDEKISEILIRKMKELAKIL